MDPIAAAYACVVMAIVLGLGWALCKSGKRADDQMRTFAKKRRQPGRINGQKKPGAVNAGQ